MMTDKRMTKNDVILERSSLPLLSLAELEQAINGELNFLWKSYAFRTPMDMKLTTREMSEYWVAKQRGFLIGKGRRHNLLNVWFQYCAATNHPFIYVWFYAKYAHVEMDLLRQSWRLSDDAYEQIKREWDEMAEKMRAVPKPTICIGKIMSMYLGIKHDYAMDIASMFLRLAQESKVEVYDG